MKKENNPLPDLLKYFRKKKHLTQEQVAKQLSVSRASYASYETGRIIPGMQHIMELSRILEHDFLFAYTLAVQNAPAGAMPEAVYEENPYLAVPALPTDAQSNERSAKIACLPSIDQKLIDTYIDLRISDSKTTNERNF
ncbi:MULTISPECIES: helix-turn-helix transcriptional regulator [Clostridia]|jgi:transcriptional regulator with XRE-family HTH domain|uniref:Helix-turn-helix transcriptional regulator n=1 Tax=Coprococcus hominis (ex Liu et al. 2022) TaxID=2763039 RepID=A0A8I0AGA9_9FIRM|nr:MULTISPECIES: helix-turn-helix transcriptional regulator [Clostridia]HAB87726.1 transcriptional regulator [Coprococcus sp.]MBC5662564.1 helix-turn-helix transcriptional regulator [Coprococcus hominis (ex Liu et al. 2022)]RGG34908.1 XRE family transcriptional regulator [Clostridium sp. AF23-6LB]RHP93536.1 XRE family transcriptional regulator [Clostridium sp. AM54-37XD]RHP97349.1 XRE family transcriptional regulator [Clostridium sp. AM54-14XD]